MLKVISGFVFVCVASLYSAASNATVDHGIFWAMCSSCTTRASFIAAGQAFYDSQPHAPTVMNLNVGNPNTGRVYFVQLVGRVGGGTGRPAPLSSRPRATPGIALIATEPQSTNVSPQMVTRAYSSSGSQVGEAYEQSQVEPTFQTMVVVYKNQILFNVSSLQAQNPAFGSLQDGIIEMQELGPAIWQEEEEHNPGFGQALGKADGTLMGALKQYFGHGMLASVIFTNGDVGTFELTSDPNTTIFIKGTGRDRNNKPTPDYTPNIGGGGHGGVGVQPGFDPPSGTYYIGGHEGIRCGFVNGTLSACIMIIR